jgi:Sortase domain
MSHQERPPVQVPYVKVLPPSPSVASTPPPQPTKKKVIPPRIAQSPVLQVYVPNSDKTLVVSSPVHILPICKPEIAPPLKGPHVSDTFTCPEVEEPGTNAPSLTLLAGHSSERISTAFNSLYLQGKNLVGKEVWLKTRASKDRWLVYKVFATYTPLKSELGNKKEIWGTTYAETANRLLLITCLQNGDGTPSEHNFVASARFTGVR